MRQLLLVALGAAGSLMVDLPAWAQLSTDTSTFSGSIAASCSMSLGDSIGMLYYSQSNFLLATQVFELNTNSPNLRMSVSRVTVNSEPQPISSSIEPYVKLYFYSNNSQTQVASGSKDTTRTSNSLATNTSSANTFRLVTGVNTSQRVNNKYELPTGTYSYSVTITCLL